uniref:DM1 locus, WD repeat containing n=1 Tax=Erpetoichthys calabaricus TaxID=27687 RepID=A0A8C4XHK9_ERPCA
MAGDGGALKDFNEIKCQFRTREGFYKLLTLSDSQQRGGGPRGQAVATGVATGSGAGSIPGAGGGGGGGGGAPGPGAGSGPASVSSASATASVAPGSSSSSTSSPAGFLPPVRVSMVKLQPESPGEESERVCFNIGRELYFYTYTNIKKRLIDKTKVTCLKWLPESEQLFLASHASGNLYLYNVEHPCGSTAPQYSLLRQGDGFTVYTCKSKTPRNPLLRWSIGEGGLNEFAFSPDGTHLACVGQDGCLRVFHFDSMELQGVMKSYFGGLLCVSWSPDGKYLATGGEDDLVTVWSFAEGRVIARGHGHKSWVNVVAFDPYTTNLEDDDQMGFSGSEEDLQDPIHFGRVRTSSTLSRLSKHSSKAGSSVTYRFGSVGQDTQFCLWDLTEDILYPHLPLSRARTLTNTFSSTIPPSVSGGSNLCSLGTSTTADGSVGHHPQHGHHHPVTHGPPLPRSLSRSNSLPHPAVTNASKGQTASEGNAPFSIGRFATLSLQERKSDKSSGGSAEKEHKRYHSLGNISKSNDKINVAPRSSRLDAAKVLGTTLCPRMNEVPLLEPLVCKKIAHERLTVLMFLDDCIITACQEGLICTWARPGKTTLTTQNGSSPSGTVV